MNARQFDVFSNPYPDSVSSHPYFIVLQTDALEHLNTRLVAPLVAPKLLPLFERLMPEVGVEGSRYVIDFTNIGAIPTRMLQKPVANLEAERDRFIGAIDLVFTGV
jgi:toxin CcdB